MMTGWPGDLRPQPRQGLDKWHGTQAVRDPELELASSLVGRGGTPPWRTSPAGASAAPGTGGPPGSPVRALASARTYEPVA
jgi:hypothetical protein